MVIIIHWASESLWNWKSPNQLNIFCAVSTCLSEHSSGYLNIHGNIFINLPLEGSVAFFNVLFRRPNLNVCITVSLRQKFFWLSFGEMYFLFFFYGWHIYVPECMCHYSKKAFVSALKDGKSCHRWCRLKSDWLH